MRKRKRAKFYQRFTATELLALAAVLGILFLPSWSFYQVQRKETQIVKAASELRGLANSFYEYEMEHESYPMVSGRDLPEEMAKFISIPEWYKKTPLGGYYTWVARDKSPYCGISIIDSGASKEDLTELDKLLDDGILGMGIFKIDSNGKPIYLIDENL